MVVDRGSGVPGSRCVVVADGATGLDVLRAAGHEVRLDGGFVCAIDGLPASGCGNNPDAGLAYWRYWHAPATGGRWSYSQVGAGGYRLPARCAVEGWVWSDSPSSDTPPRMPAPTVTCEAPVTSAPPAGTPVPATTSPGTSPPGPSASGGGSSGQGSASSSAPSRAANPPGGGGPSSTASPSATGDGGSVPPVDVAGETTVPDQTSGTQSPESSRALDRSLDEGSDSGDGWGEDGESARGSEARAETAGAPWGVLVAVLLMAGLGGAAVWRSRQQREGA